MNFLLKIWKRIQRHNREVWGFSLFIPLFLSVFALFVILTAYTRDMQIFHIVIFILASILFWFIDPWLKTFVPRHVANFFLISVYLVLSQFLVVFTGGLESQFFFVYYIVIFTGAINYGLTGSLFVTMLLFFALLPFAESRGDISLVTERWIVLFILSLMIGFLSEHRRRTERIVFQRVSKMSTLNEMGKLLKATLEKNRILSLVLEITLSILNGRYGGIYIYDREQGKYVPYLERNPGKVTIFELLQGEGSIGVIDWVEGKRFPVHIRKFSQCEPFGDHTRAARYIKSLMGATIDIDEETRIVLVVINKDMRDQFSDDDFELFHIVVNQIMITLENARLHQEIIEVKNYRDLLMNSLSYCMLAVTEAGQVQSVNRAACDLFRKSEREILGEDFAAITGVEISLFKGDRSREGSDDGEAIFTRSEGEKIPVEYAVSDFQGTGRYSGGFIIVFRDISREKAIEAELDQKRALARMGEMAATVAHEIRNPLGGIEGFASLLERDLKNSPNQAALAQKIALGAASLNRIVEQLLLFTQTSRLQKSEVPLTSIIDNSVIFIEKEIRRKNVELRKNFKVDKSFRIKVDEEKMRQVLQNIILNALESIPETEGKISITVSVDSRVAVVKIADNGPGIPEGIEDKIWEPFFTTRPRGLGLGLAISRKIVEDHGGRISIQSNRRTGCTVSIEIPLRYQERKGDNVAGTEQ